MQISWEQFKAGQLINGIIGMWESAQQDSPVDILTGNLGLVHARGWSLLRVPKDYLAPLLSG
jgi:hypothetical protein